MWRSAALMLCLGLAGCQMALPFGGAKPAPVAASAAKASAAKASAAQTSPAQATVTAKPGAIAGGAVTAKPISAKPASSNSASAQGGAAIPAGTIKGTPQPAPAKPEAAKPDPAKSEAATQAEAEAKPAPPKSAPQLACEAGGGIWSEAGKKGVKTCVQRTRDAGKSCKREGDCEGFCLARSRSCAPVTPLFGCNDILQADGGQVTLCIDCSFWRRRPHFWWLACRNPRRGGIPGAIPAPRSIPMRS